jgi:hypothetical protein
MAQPSLFDLLEKPARPPALAAGRSSSRSLRRSRYKDRDLNRADDGEQIRRRHQYRSEK